MKKRLYILLIVGIFIVSLSCKKTKDKALIPDITGTVINACTDSGMANLTVYLTLFNAASHPINYQTTTNANGGFTFPNLTLQSSGVFNSLIKVTNSTNFVGQTNVFVDSLAKKPFLLTVIPNSPSLIIYFNHSPTTAGTDSVITSLVQNKLNLSISGAGNGPSYKYYGNTAAATDTIYNIPMGWWHINSNRWLSSKDTMLKDSIYIYRGIAKTYTLNW